MIDILGIQPSVIDRSLSGKTVLLAGAPKVGKSEFCSQSVDTLILDLENGYNAHPGVKRQLVTKWSDVKTIVRQLEKPQAHEVYKNVAIDTISEAWDLCTQFICQQAGVQKINEIPYGAGYKARDDEFADVLRKIINLNYGLILTAHIKEKVIGTQNDIDIISIAPDVDKRCLPIINGLVDVIGIIQSEWTADGQLNRWLITKATPTISAGSRWAALEPKIPFGYTYLEEAIAKAIETAEKNGANVVDKVEVNVVSEASYEELMTEAKDLWMKLVHPDIDGGDEKMARTILKKIEMAFGRQMKISEITEDQKDILALVMEDIRDLAK